MLFYSSSVSLLTSLLAPIASLPVVGHVRSAGRGKVLLELQCRRLPPALLHRMLKICSVIFKTKYSWWIPPGIILRCEPCKCRFATYVQRQLRLETSAAGGWSAEATVLLSNWLAKPRRSTAASTIAIMDSDAKTPEEAPKSSAPRSRSSSSSSSTSPEPVKV